MRCPICLRYELADEGICHSCPACGGAFYSPTQTSEYFNLGRVDEKGGEVSIEAANKDEVRRGCPSCERLMDKVVVERDVVLDRCGDCRGLFFEGGETLILRGRLMNPERGIALQRAFAKMLSPSFSLGGPYR